jgi:hypothetical protein
MSAVKTTLDTVRLLVSSPTHYATRLARSMDDIRAAQSLRFQVFNLEPNEGLEQSYASGLDEDPFDAVCDHLIVEHLPSANIVGTYRLQTGHNAAAYLGYYCAQEFEFEVFEPLRAEMIELGRASIRSIATTSSLACSGKASPITRDSAAGAIFSDVAPSRRKTRRWAPVRMLSCAASIWRNSNGAPVRSRPTIFL